VAHDHVDRDGFVGRVPGVVVSGHAEEGVGDFGFAEEFAFRGGGHVDDVCGEGGAVEEGFGARGELRSFCYIDMPLSALFLEIGAVNGFLPRMVSRETERKTLPMQTIVPFSCNLTPWPSSTPSLPTAFTTTAESCLSKGSAKGIWPTTPPSKNVHGRTYSCPFSPGVSHLHLAI